ncbi:MAG: 50S ribosomal protein L3 [Myxococcales bacterium]|nr:MAG: 50S ribosomal protein L3 [Myxococcales bacterium]
MQKKQGLLATKVGMTQLFLEDGVCIPVTVLQIKDNVVVQKRTSEVDGYDAVQVAYGDVREKTLNKPKLGLFSKKNIEPKRFLREFRMDGSMVASFEEGASASLEWLKTAESLDISGISKGKGFAGVMKRHNFSGFNATHGAHETFRGGGSIGMREFPGRVLKGKRMAGQMGNERVTVKNVRIVRFMEDERILCLRGAVPGAKGALIELRMSNRKAKVIHGISGPKEEKGLKNPMKASKAGAGKGKK